MKPAIAFVISLLILAAPAFAQSAAALKRELRSMESAAKKEKTADALSEVAKWASEKGLASDAKRLFLAVLKKDPNHEAANMGLGNAMFEGKWMPKKKADVLRKKALAAEYKAKGYVEVNGIWVAKDHVADAKRGVFHHEGKRITKEEKQALLAGMVYHPNTGLLIDSANLAKAEDGQYPVGREGRWASEKNADQYHSDLEHPWVIRSTHGTIMTSLPMAKIHDLKGNVDRGCERIAPLFGGNPPLPTSRPTIIIAATIDEYRELGNSVGDENSAASAFLMTEEASIDLPFQGPVRASVCTAHQEAMAPYWTRHAAAMAYAHGKCVDVGASIPGWFAHGVGGLASFFENDRVGAHFCRTMLVPKGGVQNVKAFLNSFAINGDMDPEAINYNMAMAGLYLQFAMVGGHSKTTEALLGVTEAFGGDGNLEKAVTKLESALIKAEDEIGAYMQKLMAANK